MIVLTLSYSSSLFSPVKGEIEDRLGPKPSQPQQHQQQRSSSSYNTTSRGGRFGGRSNGRGGRHNSNSRAPKKPLTQADLDADMDSFMTGGGDVIAENRGMAIAAEENGFVVMGDAGDEDDSASKNIQDPRKIISYGEL